MKHLQRKHECTPPHERSQLPALLVAGKFFWCGDKELLKGFQFLRDGRREGPTVPREGGRPEQGGGLHKERRS